MGGRPVRYHSLTEVNMLFFLLPTPPIRQSRFAGPILPQGMLTRSVDKSLSNASYDTQNENTTTTTML